MKFSNKIFRFQEGGPMPEAAPAPEDGAMEPQQGGYEEPDQMMQQAAAIAQKLIQEIGPELAGAVFQIGMQMLNGGAQEPGLPPQEAQPAFQRKGGKVVRIR